MDMLLTARYPIEHFVNSRAQRTPALSALSVLEPAACEAAQREIATWPDYAPTPLHELRPLAEQAGIARLWYKDEGGRFGLGSFKALGGAYAVAQVLRAHIAQHTGTLAPVTDLRSGRFRELTAAVTVTCATDGNHGRSVAWGASAFGCRCVIYLHAGVSPGRAQALEALGAEIVRCPGNYDDSVRAAAAAAQAHDWIVVSDTSYPGYDTIPRHVMQGYTVLAHEVLAQLPRHERGPTHVFLQGGVGGFAAAVIALLWQRLGSARPCTVVVEPAAAACILASLRAGTPTALHGDLDTVMAGLSCGEVSLLAWPILAQGVDHALAVPDAAAVDCMRALAGCEPPLVAGESGVAGLAGLLCALQTPACARAMALDQDSRVLTIGTEGATDPDIYFELVGTPVPGREPGARGARAGRTQ